MRIVIDLQASQGSSKHRGIGRYSQALAQSMVEQLVSAGHEAIILLNRNLVEEGEGSLEGFSNSFVGAYCLVLNFPSPCSYSIDNKWRREAAKVLRETAIAQLNPDFLHVATLMSDGWDDDLIVSIGATNAKIPTAVTHYDLIPLLSKEYDLPESRREEYYTRLEYLKKADLLLTISEFSRKEVISNVGVDSNKVASISAAVDKRRFSNQWSENHAASVLKRFGIERRFLFSAPGAFDNRKNISRLIKAYALLPAFLRKNHQLVISSELDSQQKNYFSTLTLNNALKRNEVIFTDFVSDLELEILYKKCFLYICPSLYEGFGLPILEAMECGAPTIGSNCTAIPEALGFKEATFDPYSTANISSKLYSVLTDSRLYSELLTHAMSHIDKFSWESTARLAIRAIQERRKKIFSASKAFKKKPFTYDSLLDILSSQNEGLVPSLDDIEQLKKCYVMNERQVTGIIKQLGQL